LYIEIAVPNTLFN